ncbi:lysophospholipid acyltransferase family protein [Moraxella nasovis]|uniref:lysophospholipid acyltransferase family protein n=1 Tax=Moraxella nasovis TaxID=2904121 RepID=UPI001F61C77C|nr:lysophospholipid acyltransferase family protein [Moraxella nasovis]UNU73505.1 lysophospholipid acyltransferase family protein [Moraxella nasovis]
MGSNPYQLLRYVPMWMLYLLAHFASFVLNLNTNHKVMNIIRTNLLLAYPKMSETEREVFVKKSLKQQAVNMIASIKSWAMPPQWSIDQIHTVHRQQVLLDALDNPNGMLAIVPHLGAWEIMNAWLNQFGSPTIMYKPVKGELINEFVLQGRQRLNATLVPTDATGVKAIFKTLKSGGFSIILPDHVPDPSGGVVVPFFGVPTMTSTLAPKLAQKTQCALVGLTCIQREDGQGFDIYCDRLDDPNLYHKDIHTATLAFNQAIETMIERFPLHYTWNYKRFKHTPIGDDVYALDTDTLAKARKQTLKEV